LGPDTFIGTAHNAKEEATRMADPPHDTSDHAGVRPDPEPMTGTPRWVKVSAIIAVALVLLLVVVMLVGGGSHGPDRHI
jgi:hypothetical protein